MTEANSRIKKLWVGMLVVSIFLIAEEGKAETKAARICNATGQSVSVAVGWTEYLINQAKGWFPIAEGSCKILYSGDADSLGPMYAYAVGADGTEYRPPALDSTKYCIHRTQAFNYGAGICTAADEIAKGALKSQQGINTWETFGIMNPDGSHSFAWTITSLKENRQGSSKAAEAGKIPSTEKSRRPGSLGVAIQSVTPELAEAFGLKEPRGALVAEVTKDGPAEKAGIERGDVITSFNGTNIKDSHDLPPLVMETPAGDNAEVLLLRDKRERRFTVKLGERSEPLK